MGTSWIQLFKSLQSSLRLSIISSKWEDMNYYQKPKNKVHSIAIQHDAVLLNPRYDGKKKAWLWWWHVTISWKNVTQGKGISRNPCSWNHCSEEEIRSRCKAKKREKALNDDLSQQLANELHKSIRRNFVRRRIRVNGIRYDPWTWWTCKHLSKSNKGVKYLVNVIEVFSNMAGARRRWIKLASQLLMLFSI